MVQFTAKLPESMQIFLNRLRMSGYNEGAIEREADLRALQDCPPTP